MKSKDSKTKNRKEVNKIKEIKIDLQANLSVVMLRYRLIAFFPDQLKESVPTTNKTKIIKYGKILSESSMLCCFLNVAKRKSGNLSKE